MVVPEAGLEIETVLDPEPALEIEADLVQGIISLVM